jgi:hypothetical protein
MGLSLCAWERNSLRRLDGSGVIREV